MPRQPTAYRFVLDGVHNRLYGAWGRDPELGARRTTLGNGMVLSSRVSSRTAMRRYARQHGRAGGFRCDDSFVLITLVKGKLQQRTFARGIIVDAADALAQISARGRPS